MSFERPVQHGESANSPVVSLSLKTGPPTISPHTKLSSDMTDRVGVLGNEQTIV